MFHTLQIWIVPHLWRICLLILRIRANLLREEGIWSNSGPMVNVQAIRQSHPSDTRTARGPIQYSKWSGRCAGLDGGNMTARGGCAGERVSGCRRILNNINMLQCHAHNERVNKNDFKKRLMTVNLYIFQPFLAEFTKMNAQESLEESVRVMCTIASGTF